MGAFSIILIAIGLSMDSFAVAISNGLTIRDLNTRRMIQISLSLSFFQALMPAIGWLAGLGVESLIKGIDHWVAFGLLSLIGAKMLYEGLTGSGENSDSEFKALALIGQSFATSIDAFAIGISFALLKVSIITPVLIIGGVTFAFSIAGLYLGKYLGKKLGKSVEIFGGLVLMGIGLKILIEHLYI